MPTALRELNLTLSPGKNAGYLRIADAIRDAIQSGQLRPGESLPSTRALGRTLRVHRHTVMSALAELIAEGWLASQPRRSYQVHSTLPSHFFAALSLKEGVSARRSHHWRVVRSAAADRPLAPAARHEFKSGLADLRLFPHEEFRSYLNASLKLSRARVLGYGDPAGHPPLIENLKTYLRRVRALADRELIITHGSQEAIYLAAQLLIEPGDHVAVEGLGYQPAWDALKAAGGSLIPIAIDSEGLDPDALAKALRRHRVRLLYTTPLHQYPTTVTLPISRRLRLYELAARAGVPILEDDYDHEFHYRSQPLAPIASRDPDGRVIYVSTFSKVLFPSARIGFMSVPKVLAPLLAGYKRIISRQNETPLQDAVARWMASGGFERHLRKMRRTYEERRTTIVDCLKSGRAAGLPLSWIVPDGGMAVWVDVGQDADLVARKALEVGAYVQPESSYRTTPAPSRHLRLGFANQTPDELRQGMRLVFRAMSAS